MNKKLENIKHVAFGGILILLFVLMYFMTIGITTLAVTLAEAVPYSPFYPFLIVVALVLPGLCNILLGYILGKRHFYVVWMMSLPAAATCVSPWGTEFKWYFPYFPYWIILAILTYGAGILAGYISHKSYNRTKRSLPK